MFRLLDPRRMLNLAAAYSAFRAAAAGGGAARFVRDVLRPVEGERILDIGCGPADVLEHLPGVDYVGFDSQENYIRRARRRYGHRGEFLHGRVSETTLDQLAPFDAVLALGVIHHLDDPEAERLFSLAASAMKPTGRLVTIDGCFVAGQSWLRRTVLQCDRGRFVRNRDEYLALANARFAAVNERLFTDLIRLPYTHLVMECQRPLPAATSAHRAPATGSLSTPVAA